jgi:hypothetical protein
LWVLTEKKPGSELLHGLGDKRLSGPVRGSKAYEAATKPKPKPSLLSIHLRLQLNSVSLGTLFSFLFLFFSFFYYFLFFSGWVICSLIGHCVGPMHSRVRVDSGLWLGSSRHFVSATVLFLALTCLSIDLNLDLGQQTTNNTSPAVP